MPDGLVSNSEAKSDTGDGGAEVTERMEDT
jgi:hypothetical protein